MKFAEKVFIIMIITGTLFWFMHFPFSSMLKFIGGTLLFLLYFFLGFALLNGIGLRGLFSKSSYRGFSEEVIDAEGNGMTPSLGGSDRLTNRILPAILGSLGLALSTAGMVFYLLLWPGSMSMRMMGALLLVLVGLLLYLGRASSGGMWYRFWTRGLPWIVVVLITIALPKHILLDIKYKDHPAYLEAYKTYLDNPESQSAFEDWLKEDKRKYPEAYDQIE